MTLTEVSNWLSFNIYYTPDTLIGGITKYQKWYFRFLRDILKPFLLNYKNNVIYVYFGDYFYQKPVNKIIINEFDFSNWIDRFDNLKRENLLSPDEINQFQEGIRYIRLRLFINSNQRDSIIKNFIEQIEDIEYILGFELVKYDVISDLGRRFSSKKEEWNHSLDKLERLEYFIKYWDAVCRYILTIITNDYYLDFENVEIGSILHLGFHSLGSNLPIQKCQNCGGILYLMSSYQPICYFGCQCGLFKRQLNHL